MTTTTAGPARERLLQSLFDEYGEGGPSPSISMRQVAERLGVHHTLLIHHFGSRSRLLAAVLSEARRRDNLVLTAADHERGFADLCRAVWEFYSAAEHAERVKAFFHLVGLAVYDNDGYASFVADLDDLVRLLERAAVRDGLTPSQARRRSLFAVACVRGLLLQRLLAPESEVDDAAEEFLRSLETGEANDRRGLTG